MEISSEFLILVPVVLGVVQVFKKIGVASKFAPLLSLILGVAGVWVLSDFTLTGAIALEGVITGLTASGLWSGGKTTKTIVE